MPPQTSEWWASYGNERRARMEGVWEMERSASINFGQDNNRETKWISEMGRQRMDGWIDREIDRG